MTREQIKTRIAEVLPRDLVLDLFDVAVSRARQAHKLVHDNTDLQGRSARGLEGQARFRLMEKGFEDKCEEYGGLRLEGDVIQGTELLVFQPFMRFGGKQPGVLLGLASMPAKEELPTKNKSRLAGVTLNYSLTPRLPLDGRDASVQLGDIFVLLLFARDPGRAGHVEEVAIGVINAEYDSFLAYEPIETFLVQYAAPKCDPELSAKPVVKLKKKSRPFMQPERPELDDSADMDE